MTPRLATTGVFMANGAIVGSWVAVIPWVQERFELSKSEMALLVLGLAVGVLAALLPAGRAIVVRGSRRVTTAAILVATALVALPVLAPDPLLVAVALLGLGGALGVSDVGMNAHGVGLEQHLGRPIMSSLHAGWAFGGLAGAGLAAAGVAAGLDPRVTILVAAALVLAGLTPCLKALGAGSVAAADATPGFTLPSRGVALIAGLCFILMVTEGAVADWGGILLRQDVGAGAGVAALAFAAFAAGMTLGRLLGDEVNRRIGPVALLRGGAVLTGAALTVVLLAGAPVPVLAGLFVVGLGVANGVPLMFSAAGRQPGTETGPGIAAVSSMGSLGFLAGPASIGPVADAVSLPWALSGLVLGAVAVGALARRAAGGGAMDAEGATAATQREAAVAP